MGTTRAPRRQASRRPAPSTARRSRTAALVVAALAVGVYLNALGNPFVYDDFFTVTGNPSITRAADPRWALVYMPFRPVVNVSYAIDRAIWGYRPFGYHLTSILLHAGTSVLLFVFLRRMLADLRRSGHAPEGGSADGWAAFAGAALFAVHPIQSETAGYISSRSEILCALFIIGALVLAGRAVDGGSPDDGAPAGRRRARAAGAWLCGLFAMLSKEIAAGLPVLFVAYDWLVLPGPVTAKRRRVALVFGPVALLVAAAVAYRVRSLAGQDATLSSAPLLNLLTQSIVIWRYLAMMVVPTGQAIMHQTRTVATLTDPVALLAAGGLVALLGLAWHVRRTFPLCTLGAIWWFVCIAPSSSIIALGEGMAEHRVYVASAGIAMVVTALAAHVIRREAGSAGRVPARYTVALACLIALCAALTIRRNIVWASPVSVWQEARRAAPDMWETRYALGDALREAGDCPSAMTEYEAVLRDQPQHREATTNLGICLGEVGRLTEAKAAFRRTIAIDPAWVRGYTNLGAIAVLEGDTDQAQREYLRAIQVDPRNVHARMQLARIYEEVLRDYDRAARMCEEAQSIAPSTAGAGACVERNRQRARASRGGAP